MSLDLNINVNTHYTRSVNLQRDAGSESVVRSYIPTSRALKTLEIFSDSLKQDEAPRSWSLVGPYGSGKSSFASFLASLLDKNNSASHETAYRVLSRASKSTAEDLKSLDEETFLSVFEGVPQFEMNKADLGLGILDILTEKTQIFASKGEARRMIKSNAVSINKEKITEDVQLSENDLLNGKYILAQKGKKNYFLIIVS